jgi:hypothetical protein
MTITVFLAWIGDFGHSWLNRHPLLVFSSRVSASFYDRRRNPLQPDRPLAVPDRRGSFLAICAAQQSV